jgi:hypothetical protein
MIDRKTVFVLGAGAHMPYGFPDGARLINGMLELIPSTHNADSDFTTYLQAIFGNRVTPRQWVDFRTTLALSGHTSIDSFLATHAKRPGFTEIGKHAVAWQLLPKEFRHDWSRQAMGQHDWMTFLFQSMLSGCLDSVDALVTKNDVSFVTFNYDRCLEDFLCTRIAHTYHLSHTEAWQGAQKLKIVHVYGSLGEFDPFVIEPQHRRGLSQNVLAHGNVTQAANSIRLMYEDRTDHSGVTEASD